MKHITLYSPNGKTVIGCSPDRVDYLLSAGWTKEPKFKRKSKKVKANGND